MQKINLSGWKRTFAIIWTGQLFSTLSSSVAGYAVVFWLSLRTQSAEVLAYAMIATLLPHIVLGLFTGVFVDRWDRKRTMIFADSFIAICTAVLCLMFYLDKIEIWQIYILLALRSIGNAFHTPAMQSSIPLLAPESQLMRIAGVNQVIFSISNIAGPALAAFLISILDMTYVMMFDILGAAIAVTSLLFVTIPNPERKNETPDILREIKQGIMAIFNVKGLGWLLSFDVLVVFFMIPASALFPLMTVKYFMGDEFHMSIVEIAWGVGMLIGGGLIGLKKMKTYNKVGLILAMNTIFGLTFLLSGLLSQSAFTIFVILTAFGGIASSIWNGAFVVILQTKIEPEKLGRVFSTYDSMVLLPSLPGLLFTGYIAETIGISNTFVISGSCICALGILMLFIPSVLELGRTAKGQNLIR